jgi:hypothetical protein
LTWVLHADRRADHASSRPLAQDLNSQRHEAVNNYAQPKAKVRRKAWEEIAILILP